MPNYLISYDLNKEQDGQDYGPLIAELKRAGAVRTQKSVWFLMSAQSQQAILDALKTYVDKNDYLMVVTMTLKPSFTLAMKGTNDWLAKAFP